jgi:hypothetical protein
MTFGLLLSQDIVAGVEKVALADAALTKNSLT